MRHLNLLAVLAMCIPCMATAQSDEAAYAGSGIITPGAEVELLAEGFSFTEGPAVDRKGNVFFTDQPKNLILEWTTGGKLLMFHYEAGRANGMFFDRRGNLITASDAENELWSISPDGSHEVILRGYDGKEFNGPNDLWVHPVSGDIYFTDPLYARPWWTHRTAEMQQDGEHVYYLPAGSNEAIRIADDLRKPNGIIGTPDGRTLYVADIGAGKTYAYDIAPDGTLTNKRLFASKGSDGMTIDSEGNVYVTGRGVTVFNSRGEQIEQIDIPEDWTANVTFGGKDRKTLFITASKSLYALRMNVKGVK